MMKHFILLVLSLFILSSCKTEKTVAKDRIAPTERKENGLVHMRKETGEFAPRTLIIMVDAEVGKEPLRKAVEKYGATIVYDYNLVHGMAIRIPDGGDIHKTMAYFKKVEGVVSVERDRIRRLADPVKPKIVEK